MSYLVCPECGATRVIVREVHSVFINTHEHYCHSVKAHDDYAEVICLECEFEGTVKDLREVE